MGKEYTEENKAPGIPGTDGVTQAQVDAWKKQYNKGKSHKVHKLSVKVDSEGGKEDIAVCYLRPMDRDDMAFVLSRYKANNVLEAREYMLNNCFLGGDPRIQSDDNVKMGACMQIGDLVDFMDGSIKEA